MTDYTKIVDVEESSASAMNDDLQFQDFSDSKLLDDVGVVENDEDSEMLGNLPSDGEEDNTELLSGRKKSPPLWSFDYYQQFFDVDTSDVIKRLFGSFIPQFTTNYLDTHLRPSPDLYGPFWVCATLVFTIAIGGDMLEFFSHWSDEGYHHHPHFVNVTVAALIIFGYTWLVPLSLYFFAQWRGIQGAPTFLECVCLYGYSLTLYVPVTLLLSIDSGYVQWSLIVVAFALSFWVLVLSLWSAFDKEDQKVAIALMVIAFLLHAALILGIKFYFFQVRENSQVATVAPPHLRTTVSSPLTKSHPKVNNSRIHHT